ncbi:MAG: TonB family protein [Mariprofundaceae bacterium]
MRVKHKPFMPVNLTVINSYHQQLFTACNRAREEHQSAWLSPASFVLAAIIHLLLLIQFGSLSQAHITPPIPTTMIEVSLVRSTQIHQEILEPKQEMTEPQKKVIMDPVKKTPQPIQKTKVPKVMPTKHLNQVKPQQPSIKTNTSATQTEEHQPHKITQEVVIKSNLTDFHKRNTTHILNLQKEYLSRIMTRIESHKIYPYSARRRHIEGQVTISFQVSSTGHISNLQMNSPSSVLKRACMNALQDSLPLPLPPKTLQFPIQQRFIMAYQLQ